MVIKEIRIRKLGGGYQYKHLQDNGIAVATQEITAFAAIRSMVGQIGKWEEERKREKIDELDLLGGAIPEKINELIRTVNNLKGVDAKGLIEPSKEGVREIIEDTFNDIVSNHFSLRGSEFEDNRKEAIDIITGAVFGYLQKGK